MTRRGRLQRMVRAVATSMLGLTLLSCSRAQTAEWNAESGYRWRELRVVSGEVGFTRVDARNSGIEFQNSVSDTVLRGNRVLGQGAGVALGDVDGDGLVDVFLARTEGCSALYRNRGGLRFDDITSRAKVGACDRHSTGAAFADVDGDRDLDLVLLSTTGPNAIFLNDSTGTFSERRDLGLDATGRGGTTITMADVDGSGRLAMYVANYKPYNVDDTIPPQQRAFNQMVREVSKGKFEIAAEHRRDYKLVMRPDMGGLRMTQRAESDEFYINDGAGHFTRVPPTSDRFRDARGNVLTEAPESFGLGARFTDLDGDGAPDLYVANDFEDTDELWYNDGRGNFKLADWTAQRQLSNSTMGFDVADVNGDGLPDLFTVDMLANDSRRLKTQIPTNTALPKKPGDIETQLQQQRNALFINRGDRTFAEVAQFAGVGASGWSWGTTFLDVDLDGLQDVLIANGHLWDIMDADVQEGLQNRLNAIEWQRLRWQFPPLKLRNVALRNNGNLTFTDASSSWRFGVEEDISHALATGDLDGDGDHDVVVNRLGAPALLMRNDAPGARVSVRLVGEAPNTRAVGAKLSLNGGAVPLQTREIVVGGLYMSHSDYAVSFAMGASTSATLQIDWRDGRRTTLRDIKPNREYEVTMATATSRADSTSIRDSSLFVDATEQLGGHRHTEDSFDDWDRQFLLPNALSQLGPGVAWYDLDRDGADELIVGTGKGGRVAVFRNVNGRLSAMPAQGPVANSDFTSVLGFNDAGRTRLLAGVATWQLRSEAEMVAQPAAVEFGMAGARLSTAMSPAVGSHSSSTGPLALGDVNGDGRVDLFVGSRAVPQQYPLPASSGLFRNVNGKFEFDTLNALVLRDVGMVSAAMFADMNGDGHADLVLAREWNSLLLLLNDGRGRLQPAPDDWGLDRLSSRWNGVAAGDLDGDGRLDLVATSWGRNTSMHADSTTPLLLVHGPFGARKEQEMLFAQQDARLNAVAPLNSYARTRVAFPDLVNRVGTFAAYADASLETALGPAAQTITRLTATTLDHVALLNRGDHFDVVPLPTDAQLAPAFYAGIADLDGDGAEDVFVGQNFSPTMVGVPRFDAGRGVVLRGDGRGALTAMTGVQSGIAVYGDMRGAGYADFNNDGRLDLAVSQNGNATRLFSNRGAKPGLRVRVSGGAANADGIGTQLRLMYGERMGPVREVQAGAGYWSQNGAVQLFGLSGVPTAVWVRWPGGATTTVPVPSGAREVVVARK